MIITSQLELIIMVTKVSLNVASFGPIVKALLLVNYQQQETILKLFLNNFKSCFKDNILWLLLPEMAIVIKLDLTLAL